MKDYFLKSSQYADVLMCLVFGLSFLLGVFSFTGNKGDAPRVSDTELKVIGKEYDGLELVGRVVSFENSYKQFGGGDSFFRWVDGVRLMLDTGETIVVQLSYNVISQSAEVKIAKKNGLNVYCVARESRGKAHCGAEIKLDQ